MVDDNEVQKGTFIGSYDKEVNVLVDDNGVQRGTLVGKYDDEVEEVTVKLVNVSGDDNDVQEDTVVDRYEVNGVADDNEVYWDTVEGDNEDTRGDPEGNAWLTSSKNIRVWWRWI